MTLNTSDNKFIKWILVLTLVVTVVGLWNYLASGILMLFLGQQYEDASLLTLYQYWYYYWEDPEISKWISISSGIALAVILSPGLFFLSPNRRSLFGDARFATRREIKAAGLLGEHGIIVGQYCNTYLVFDGQQHVIISAPTRSGKGTGIVIPNLLNWPKSIVVLDIKQENWDITSGFRHQHGQFCYLFNPAATDYRSHRYNPLFYISKDENFRINDVQKIANMLFPDKPGTDVIWTATPRSLFMGIVLFLLETSGKPVTLGQVLRESLVDGDGSAYFGKLINDREASNNALSDACVRGLQSYTSIASENTRSGIIGGFRSSLELWMNPLVDAATSGNDFDLRDVRKKKMSIYIGITPDNLERLAPLVNLFFQQLIDLNTRELPNQNKDIKHECILLMDEFTAIGKIPILSKGISYIAGYWLRMMPIIQSPAQLVEVYGKDAAQTFQTNHALQIVYPPKASETQTARDISEWLGYQTVKGYSQSKSKAIFGKRTPTENTSDQRRALLLPQEITGLGKSKELVVVEDTPPILATKVQYFKDSAFMDRLKQTAASLKDLKGIPTRKEMDAAIEVGELAAPVPTIDLEAHNRDISGKARRGAVTAAPRQPLSADPIPSIPSPARKTLEEFCIDFSAVEKPMHPDKMDIQALLSYADDLSRYAGMVFK